MLAKLPLSLFECGWSVPRNYLCCVTLRFPSSHSSHGQLLGAVSQRSRGEVLAAERKHRQLRLALMLCYLLERGTRPCSCRERCGRVMLLVLCGCHAPASCGCSVECRGRILPWGWPSFAGDIKQVDFNKLFTRIPTFYRKLYLPPLHNYTRPPA